MKQFRKRLQTCKEKKQYDKKGALTLRNWWWHKERKVLKVYPCPFGNHWHLTSTGRGL